MRIFLIDFENVHNDGLMGVDMLTEDDEVVIFYSANADSISFEMLHKFMFCKAKLNYYKVRRGGKNALDFQLSSFLGYKIKINPDADFYIISKDNGFDFVIDFWAYGYIELKPSIRRFNSIKTILTWLSGQAAQNAVERANAIQAVEKMISNKVEKPVDINIDKPENDISKLENEVKIENTLVPIENTVTQNVITNTDTIANTNTETDKKDSTVKADKPSIIVSHNAEEKVIEKPEKPEKLEKPKPKPRQTPKKQIKTPVNVKTNESFVEKEVNDVQIPVEITEKDLTVINELMSKANSTQELYIAAVKQFGQKKGVEIYSASKGQFSAMLKANGN